MRTLPSEKTTLTGSILGGASPQHCIISSKPSDSRIGYFAVLGEHGRDHIHNDVKLGLVRRGDVDEDVPSAQGNLAVFRIDDRWHREDAVLRVVDDRIHRRIADDVQVPRKVLLSLFRRYVRLTALTSIT